MTARLPTRLAHPPISWHRRADVVVIGSGVAGLSVALAAAPTTDVLVVSKGAIDAGSTAWAQGGVATAVANDDRTSWHADDTVVAGAGLCDPAAVRVVTDEGPTRLAQLISRGARFDRRDDGHLQLTREGGHGRNRVVHAGGDATGREVQRALGAALRQAGVPVLEDAFVLDVVHGAPGPDGLRPAAGVLVAVRTADGTESVGLVEAAAVVLATGGVGQLYATSTNPVIATGDGLAVALRAGASVADVEFVQFHPTVLWSGAGASGQQFLVSEAVRGEGAVLVDAAGRRVMTGVHPLADLAPRDVVARAIAERLLTAPAGVTDHVYLDATALGRTVLEARFPTILAACRERGIEPVTDPIPVAPGAHFSCGGVLTDPWGRTDVPGLYAVGEVACSGVHGANRLASNSLLEGLVFGERVAARLVLDLPLPGEPVLDGGGPVPSCRSGAKRRELVDVMTREAGLRRDGEGLARAATWLDGDGDTLVPDGPPGRADWEATNLHAVGRALVAAADLRTESRGCHWRSDFPAPDPAWQHHLVSRLDGEGRLVTTATPAAAWGQA